MSEEIEVMVFCPKCHTRLFDKVSVASGKLRIKCPRCKEIVQIDLAFRLSRRSAYRARQDRLGL